MARGRPKKITENESINVNTNINTNETVKMSSVNENLNTDMSPEKFIETYSNTLYSLMRQINNNPSYFPHYGNSLMKDINISPYKPTASEIEKWLLQPHRFEQQLAQLSQHLEGVIMQYTRTVYYFATLLTFNYYIYPINTPTKKDEVTAFKNSYKKALDWLRKFRPKEQFQNAMLGIIREGGKFYYIRESEYIDLQELPPQNCIITGRTSIGYSYSFDMSFFLRAPHSLNDYASEFTEWFEDFYDDIKISQNYYKQIPIESSVVFLFDDTKAARLNPLRGLFKDVLDVQIYKELLKAKSQLDTWKLVYLKAPVDKDGKPTLSMPLISSWLAAAQSALPYGVVAFGSPLEGQVLNIADNQSSVSNIASLATSQFWEHAGVNSNIMGNSDAKTASAIKASIEADVNFVSHLYPMFERFVNFQLAQKTGNKFRWGVKFFGDKFHNDSIQKELKDAIQYDDTNYIKWQASLGYEPFETSGLNDMMDVLGIRKKIKPMMSSHTLSGNESKNGRPTAEESGNSLGDAGEITADAGSNVDKIVD